MSITPLGMILTSWAAGLVVFFHDALALSVSRPGRRFTRVHPSERWLHPLKILVVAAWAGVVHGTDWDRPLVSLVLPAGAVAAVGWSGCALALTGLILTCRAKRALGASFASRLALHEAHALVMRGPYRVTRHPIYTGVLGCLWGVVLAADSAAGLLTWGVFFSAMIYAHTLAEEALLRERFGEAYERYRREVPRLLPRLGRRPAGGWL